MFWSPRFFRTNPAFTVYLNEHLLTKFAFLLFEEKNAQVDASDQRHSFPLGPSPFKKK